MIVVVGSGYIGSFIADYLAENDDTTVLDVSERALANCRVAKTVRGDVKAGSDIIRRADLVVTALPGNSALDSVRQIATMGKDIVDVSFIKNGYEEVGDIAASKGSFYIPHCGFAPGLTNMLAGSLSEMGFNERIEIYCGGLPIEIENPLGYTVTWSVEGLIDEYVREARYVNEGTLKEVDPLDDIEVLEIKPYGTFEAFYSDGLATLLNTKKIKNIFEKTLRFPGHLEKIKFMRDIGMFSDSEFNGIPLRDYTASLLEKLPGKKEDQCLLLARGYDAQGRKHEYLGYDSFDYENNRTSMCRMTGLTCASTALSLLDDPESRTGLIETEYLGSLRERRESIFNRLLTSGIKLTESS